MDEEKKEVETSRELLIGLKSIKSYVGVSTDRAIKKLIQSGLPVRKQGCRYYSTKRAIDEHFYRLAFENKERAMEN